MVGGGSPRDVGGPRGPLGLGSVSRLWCRGGRDGLALPDLHTVLHVVRPVRLLARLVAVVGIPAAVVLSLLHTVAALWGGGR